MKKRYWLRGGIIGLIIFGVLIALTILVPHGDMGNLPGWILLFLALPVYIMLGILERFSSFRSGFGPISGFLILTIPYSFVFGSILGWLYGKIKNRNKVI